VPLAAGAPTLGKLMVCAENSSLMSARGRALVAGAEADRLDDAPVELGLVDWTPPIVL
jgi:hypothetical protein